MAFTGNSYAEFNTALDEISRILRDEKDSLERSKLAFSDAISRLDSMLQTYSGIDTAASTFLAANPGRAARQEVSSRLQELMENRDTLRARADAMQSAVAAL